MIQHTIRKHSLARRRLLLGFAWFSGVLLAGLRPALAAATLTKEMVTYKLESEGTQSCKDCIHFLKSRAPEKEDQCAVIQGGISPNGHCVVWAPRKPVEGC